MRIRTEGSRELVWCLTGMCKHIEKQYGKKEMSQVREENVKVLGSTESGQASILMQGRREKGAWSQVAWA